MTEENVTIVFHGFLNLNAREKLQLVEEINNYFDATDEREAIRAANERKFSSIEWDSAEKKCRCCGK